MLLGPESALLLILSIVRILLVSVSPWSSSWFLFIFSGFIFYQGISSINYKLTLQAHCWVQAAGVISHLCQLQSHHPLYKEAPDRGCPCLCGIYHQQVSVGDILLMQLPWLWRDAWRVSVHQGSSSAAWRSGSLHYCLSVVDKSDIKHVVQVWNSQGIPAVYRALLHKGHKNSSQMGAWAHGSVLIPGSHSFGALNCWTPCCTFGFRQWSLLRRIISPSLFGPRGSNVDKIKSSGFGFGFGLVLRGDGGQLARAEEVINQIFGARVTGLCEPPNINSNSDRTININSKHSYTSRLINL